MIVICHCPCRYQYYFPCCLSSVIPDSEGIIGEWRFISSLASTSASSSQMVGFFFSLYGESTSSSHIYRLKIPELAPTLSLHGVEAEVLYCNPFSSSSINVEGVWSEGSLWKSLVDAGWGYPPNMAYYLARLLTTWIGSTLSWGKEVTFPPKIAKCVNIFYHDCSMRNMSGDETNHFSIFIIVHNLYQFFV